MEQNRQNSYQRSTKFTEVRMGQRLLTVTGEIKSWIRSTKCSLLYRFIINILHPLFFRNLPKMSKTCRQRGPLYTRYSIVSTAKLSYHNMTTRHRVGTPHPPIWDAFSRSLGLR